MIICLWKITMIIILFRDVEVTFSIYDMNPQLPDE